MFILALDISTTTTGYSIFNDKELIRAGAIETKTSKRLPDLPTKMDYLLEEVDKILKLLRIEPDLICAEQALLMFSPGASSAQTIGSLVAFNFCFTYNLSRRYKSELKYINVRSARTKLGIKISKGAKGQDKKIPIIEYVKSRYPELDYPLKKTGAYKDFVGDMCDSVVIGLNSQNQK